MLEIGFFFRMPNNSKQWDPKTLTQPFHEVGVSETQNILNPSLDGPKKAGEETCLATPNILRDSCTCIKQNTTENYTNAQKVSSLTSSIGSLVLLQAFVLDPMVSIEPTFPNSGTRSITIIRLRSLKLVSDLVYKECESQVSPQERQ